MVPQLHNYIDLPVSRIVFNYASQKTSNHMNLQADFTTEPHSYKTKHLSQIFFFAWKYTSRQNENSNRWDLQATPADYSTWVSSSRFHSHHPPQLLTCIRVHQNVQWHVSKNIKPRCKTIPSPNHIPTNKNTFFKSFLFLCIKMHFYLHNENSNRWDYDTETIPLQLHDCIPDHQNVQIHVSKNTKLLHNPSPSPNHIFLQTKTPLSNHFLFFASKCTFIYQMKFPSKT